MVLLVPNIFGVIVVSDCVIFGQKKLTFGDANQTKARADCVMCIFADRR